ncbi:MAG: hypothetical protein LBK13_12660 [Spirochaetales bacterium]|jgi:DNA-binding GntR family transcriptional regulator|nr:hypothetical protein [Spirochaetales bacterium]
MVSTRWAADTAEHMAVVNAILNENFAEAAACLREHLENAKSHAYNMLIQNGGWLHPGA